MIEQKISLKNLNDWNTDQIISSPCYNILLLNGAGEISIDHNQFVFSKYTILFATPYQKILINHNNSFNIRQLTFHGDFYCIEYHKKEVACNGLLFNNIYIKPFISISEDQYRVFKNDMEHVDQFLKENDPHVEPIVKAYLQVILAKASRLKMKELHENVHLNRQRHPIEKFQTLLEEHYLTKKQPAFYADALLMSTNSFSRKCKEYFGKSPSEMLQERVILEAKKLLHLSYKSVKEVATALHFEDEHYFSRYFKKYTGVSPTLFRKKVGISIVADLSKK
ncbi:helix-turn-helix domain-containing protein [Olivibacter domesticus]|uniref:AraC-type DNA-binding protein n=1 Tax=Olivibacter domesticus TaxID=407022 RepID=A0A1H7W2P0_OLID1|nr:helix-turn-helix domain-containing protein [Olivibacter domesticus]SEM15770.1 AraC-type DNA-binding protein [Olivibacter domesticus]